MIWQCFLPGWQC